MGDIGAQIREQAEHAQRRPVGNLPPHYGTEKFPVSDLDSGSADMGPTQIDANNEPPEKIGEETSRE